MEIAKNLMFEAWANGRKAINKILVWQRGIIYGNGVTSDQLWDSLPERSKNYWIEQSQQQPKGE